MACKSKSVPYFSQWESREITSAVIADGPAAALRCDPQWASSGAHSVEEYVAWASHMCGMACLKMILAARTGRVVPTLELARACMSYGGYIVGPVPGDVEGLIYAPFVRFIHEIFGMRAEVITHISAHEIPALFARADYFIASVHSSIRWPDRTPPAKGGHLVLAIEASTDTLVFHNPSGHDPRSQEYASMSLRRFDDFFAGRGIAILP